jgi:hypothetical protein
VRVGSGAAPFILDTSSIVRPLGTVPVAAVWPLADDGGSAVGSPETPDCCRALSIEDSVLFRVLNQGFIVFLFVTICDDMYYCVTRKIIDAKGVCVFYFF